MMSNKGGRTTFWIPHLKNFSIFRSSFSDMVPVLPSIFHLIASSELTLNFRPWQFIHFNPPNFVSLRILPFSNIESSNLTKIDFAISPISFMLSVFESTLNFKYPATLSSSIFLRHITEFWPLIVIAEPRLYLYNSSRE